MLLHSAEKEIDDKTVTAVLTAAGVDVDGARVKALVSSLGSVDIGEAMATAVAAPVAAPVVAAPVATVDAAAPAAITGDVIESPMVGTYYASPSPEAGAFVKAGDTVKKGQTLCILEAMKIMNEVEAEFDCKILELLVEDGSPVEYDMPLFVIEKI